MVDNRIMSFGTVIDVNDPLLLNRVRVDFNLERKESILKSIDTTYQNKNILNNDKSDVRQEFKWTEVDPFCFLPLIPSFVNLSLKEGESVNLIFPRVDKKFDEQYYVQASFSSPLTMYHENESTQRDFAARYRLKDPKLLKDPKTNEYYNQDTKGVFPEPVDFGLQGRGTCDILLKERDIILRAARSTTLPDNANKKIIVNPKRAFVQLSDYTQKETIQPPKKYKSLQENVSYVKTLVEWYITNPETNYDNFIYQIFLYRLPEKPQYTTKNIKIDSTINSTDKLLIFEYNVTSSSKIDMINTINKFISQCNDGQINLPNSSITNLENQFPLYFRPSELTYNQISQPNTTSAYKNITDVLNGLSFKSLNQFGLVSSKDRTGTQYTIIKDTQNQKQIEPDTPTTYNIQGAEKLVFLSHSSRIPSKKQIVLNKDGVYGIEQSTIVEEILPNTDPMVRGDELKKFLNVIYKFLINHVHPHPGVYPDEQATDGTTKTEITALFNSFDDTILNQNIRIN
jgi:hypothetical protein